MKIRHSIESNSRVPMHCAPSLAARAVVLALLLCLSSVQSSAQQSNQQPTQQNNQQQTQQNNQQQGNQQQTQQNNQQQSNQQQMRGLDEEVQQIKSDTLSIAAELNQLEEKLLYPSGTQVAIFVALAKGDQMRLDAVRLQVDGQLVAHYIYSFKELEALRKGGVQRIYVGNVATGDHKLEVVVDGKLEGGADFSRTEHFSFSKEVKPKMLGLTVAGSGNTPIALGEW